MLEPAVRPIPAPAGAASTPAANLPIENRNFESLLEETRQMNLTADTAAPGPDGAGTAAEHLPSAPVSASQKTPDLLAALRQVDRIDNSSLRAAFDGKTLPDH